MGHFGPRSRDEQGSGSCHFPVVEWKIFDKLCYITAQQIYVSVDHVGQSGQCGVRSTNLGYRPEGVISDKNAQISKILTGLSGVLLLCGAKDVSTTVEHCSYRHTTTFPSCRRRAQRLRRRRQRRVHLQPRRVRPSLSTPISRQGSIQ